MERVKTMLEKCSVSLEKKKKFYLLVNIFILDELDAIAGSREKASKEMEKRIVI